VTEGVVDGSGVDERPEIGQVPLVPPGAQFTSHEPAVAGRARRKAVPRVAHAGWEPRANRRDPIELLEASNVRRMPELVPTRSGQMLEALADV